jgi:hypothetical protein
MSEIKDWLQGWDEVAKHQFATRRERYNKAKEFFESQKGEPVKHNIYLVTGTIIGTVPSFGQFPKIEVRWDNGAENTAESWIDISALTEEERMNWVVYEHDDDLPVHIEPCTLPEMKEKLVQFFKDGYCDTHLVPIDEYLKIVKEDAE